MITRPYRAGQRATRLNGVDQYGVADWIAARANPFAVGEALTLLARVKMAVPGGIVTLAGWSADTSNATPTARIYVDTSGAAHWFRKHTATGGGDIAGPTVADGTWHSLALVDDDGAIAWYMDGAAGATGTIARPGSSYVSSLWTAGAVRYSGSIAQYLDGDLAELAVLNRALSQDEIARWSDGTLDLRAYGEDLVAWFWTGDPPSNAAAAPNMAGQRDPLLWANSPTIVGA